LLRQSTRRLRPLQTRGRLGRFRRQTCSQASQAPAQPSRGNGSTMTGYSSFGIAGFSDSVDETYQPTDVHRLHRAPEWYGQHITLCRIRHVPVGAATTGWNTPDGMLAAKGCDIVVGPIAGGWPRI
jgi:hypothetical protein